MKLELKKFDPSVIKNDSVVVFIGKRNTGKSYCMKDILSYHKNIPVGVVISPTEKANCYFEKFIPKMLIYDEYEPSITKKFLERQIKINKENNDHIKKKGISDIDPRAFLIFDDCLYDKSWINDKYIRSTFMNGRHYKIFFLITMQHAMGLPPVLRGNIDYVFIFRNNIIKEQEKIYHHYAGMCPTFQVFQKILNATTSNYECLVIDNKTQSNKLEDQIKWYKAKENNFKMCSEELWDLCALEQQKKDMEDICNEDGEDEDNEPYDPNIFTKNRDKVKLTIKKKLIS